MKYPVVQTLSGQGFKVSQVCAVVGVNRAGLYKWLGLQKHPGPSELRRRDLSQQILAVHQESRKSYGVRRVQTELKFGRRIQATARLFGVLCVNLV